MKHCVHRRLGLLLGVLALLAPACSDSQPTQRTIQPEPPAVVVQPSDAATTTFRLPASSVVLPCTVSRILVPSCGAWLGTSVPALGNRLDNVVGLQEYESVTGHAPDIVHLYRRDADPFPTPEDIALVERPGLPRSLLFYNWKPSTTQTWSSIADGAVDNEIRSVAAGLRSYPHPIFLAIHHEPENDLREIAGSGMTAADYVSMYRHTVELLRREGVTNAVLVMNYMGISKWASIVDDLYPGDDVVDWIAYDPYAHRGALTLEDVLDRPDGTWPGFYSWATRRAPGKPLMLGEFGFDSETQLRGAALIADATTVLADRFPMIKALVYWNSSTDDFTYRLDQRTTASATFAAAYAAFAADEYFSASELATAP